MHTTRATPLLPLYTITRTDGHTHNTHTYAHGRPIDSAMCGYDEHKVVFLTHGTQPVLPDFDLAVIIEALQVCRLVCSFRFLSVFTSPFHFPLPFSHTLSSP